VEPESSLPHAQEAAPVPCPNSLESNINLITFQDAW